MADEAVEMHGEVSIGDIDLGQFAPYLVHNLDMHFQRLLSQVLSKFKLSVADWRTLVIVTRRDVLTIDEIARTILVPQSTASRTVERLHQKGLLRKDWSERDARVAEIRISSAGKKLKIAATDAVVRAVDENIARIAGPDAATWIDSMRKILLRLGPEKYLDVE